MDVSVRRILTGIGSSPGLARGKVKIVKGLDDAERFSKGDILVARITDPSMVGMVAKAGAILCDLGGMTSHPSIVSRELGIPCVVNTKAATEKLREGMEVVVDGIKGEVYLVV